MATDYGLLCEQLEGLLSNEADFIANCANTSALLFQEIGELNWVGVYLLQGNDLVLGPFQGKPACSRIPLGQGVCGQAAESLQTLRVPDVHAFDGHIACDTASNSELVIPLLLERQLFGVLDLDSPLLDRFTEQDQEGLEQLSMTLLACSEMTAYIATTPALDGDR